ncbi:MAG TPA: TrbI/VirB10 family protein [Terriglobia bacterium]|nr:TrbI/VirB10 family protein [Terriglobia bacterium]
MTDPQLQPQKLDPEGLALRASPRPVVRFKRRLLIGMAALGSAGIFAVTWLALKSPSLHLPLGEDRYNAEKKPVADGLAKLPGSYGDLAKPVPQLGPPLPGDLGPPILDRERQLGLTPPATGSGFQPNPEDDTARAERLRLAQQARQAREAAVLFQLSRHEDGAAQPVARQATAGNDNGNTADPNRLNLDPDKDPNNQQRKLDFLNQPAARSIYNDFALQTPASPYEVLAGSVISASLITGINADLPGEVIAQVTENVYDTGTGQFLLIPQGSRLIGAYDSVVAFGQNRVLVIWQRLIMPDGSSIQIENLPATDAAGYAGLEDEVDYHTWSLLKGVALATLTGVGSELSIGGDGDLIQAIRQSAQQNASQAGQQLVGKDLNRQPTITVRAGWSLKVIVHKDLVFRPYQS